MTMPKQDQGLWILVSSVVSVKSFCVLNIIGSRVLSMVIINMLFPVLLVKLERQPSEPERHPSTAGRSNFLLLNKYCIYPFIYVSMILLILSSC